jgi:hypothetical protein
MQSCGRRPGLERYPPSFGFRAQHQRHIADCRAGVEWSPLRRVLGEQIAQSSYDIACAHRITSYAGNDASQIGVTIQARLQDQISRISARLHRAERLIDFMRNCGGQFTGYRQP